MILLILLLFCHWLADYTHLSTNWMLSAKRLGKPLFPIFCHALTHALLMGIVIAISLYLKIGYNAANWKYDKIDSVIFIELSTHFLIDVLKGRLNGWFPKISNPANKYHWYVFGLDQFLHQIVIVYIVYFLGYL